MAVALVCALAAATVWDARRATADSGGHLHNSYIFMDCADDGDTIEVNEGDQFVVEGEGHGPHARSFRGEHTSVWFSTSIDSDADAAALLFVDVPNLDSVEKSFWSDGNSLTYESFTFRFNTTEDQIAEADETFKIDMSRDDNEYHDDTGKRNVCTVKIIDDEITVRGVRIISSPADGTTYRTGESIEIEVEFTDEVAAVAANLDSMSIYLGDAVHAGDWRGATYARANGATKAIYAYEVKSGDLDTNGITISRSEASALGSGAFVARDEDDRDGRGVLHNFDAQANVAGHQVDGRGRVTEVEVASTPGDGRAYRVGEDILVDVTFDGAVDVSGTPVVALWFAESAYRAASYLSGTGTQTLRFRYRVRAGDQDLDGLTIGAQTEQGLGADTIKNAGTQVNAVHSYDAQRDLEAHKVWTFAPEILGSTFRLYAGGLHEQTSTGNVVRFEPSIAEHLRVSAESDSYTSWSIENLDANKGSVRNTEVREAPVRRQQLRRRRVRN